MPNLVIAALPSEDDYVNRISSEKVAHMTLLFLGDVGRVQNLSKILEFTEHASKGLKRFGLDVDRRGELGEDNADVLFFRKSKWGCYPDLVQFRSDLLKENNIRLAYDSTEQHEEWLPHLTLGYPEAPAKEDNRDYPGIQYVNFNRIAVWFKEFEGVEFPLANWDEDYVLMSDLGQNIVNELIHISEKPWGDYTEADYTLEQWHKACLIHLHDGAPTSKTDCKLPVRTPGGALNRNGVHAALAALHGARSPLKASAEQKAKAANKLRRLYKELGEDIPDSLSQSDIIEVGEDFLEHFGVKGMKWGHRKENYKLSDKQISRGLSESSLRIGYTPKDYEDARRDAKWLKKNFKSGSIASLNAASGHPITRDIAKTASKNMKPEIKVLNKKPEYNTRQVRRGIKKYKYETDSPDPVVSKYKKEVSAIYMKHVKEAATERTGLSPSGKWESEFVSGGRGSQGYWYIGLKSRDGVRHTDISDPDLAMLVSPIYDEDGYIIDVVPFSSSLDHSDIIENILKESDSDILEHFGIKGMRWGHRKEQITTAVSSRVPHLTDSQKSTAKKVAIGVGASAAVVGGAYVAYKLHQSGKISLPGINRSPAKIDELLKQHGTVRLNRKEYQRTVFRKRNKDVQLNLIKAFRMREEAQAKRLDDRQRYIDLMRFSGKYKPSLEEATRIATETYPDVSLKDI